jgi:hypothetical protein
MKTLDLSMAEQSSTVTDRKESSTAQLCDSDKWTVNSEVYLTMCP